MEIEEGKENERRSPKPAPLAGSPQCCWVSVHCWGVKHKHSRAPVSKPHFATPAPQEIPTVAAEMPTQWGTATGNEQHGSKTSIQVKWLDDIRKRDV